MASNFAQHGDQMMNLIKIARKRFVRHIDHSRTLLLGAVLCLIPGLCGCSSLFPPKLPPEVYQEEWRIVGCCRYKGDQWFAVLDFPQKKLTRLVCVEAIPDPEGWTTEKPSPDVYAYSKEAKVLVCGSYSVPSHDVWIYYMENKKSKWIARDQWKKVSGFAWSEDGQKLAFIATAVGLGEWDKPVPGSVYIYDLATEKLTEVADDGMLVYMSQISSPVWSEDGRYLYYASIGRDVVRIEMSTLRKEVFPWHAYAVITVSGDYIVYINDHIPFNEPGGGAQVIKRKLQSEQDRELLYTACKLFTTIVSPSRRFILMEDARTYYGGQTILIDLETPGRFYANLWHYTRLLYDIQSTVPVPPEKSIQNEK